MLLNIIQKCEPLRKKEWETEVSRKYNFWAEKNGVEMRDVESLRKKFTTLSKVSPDEYRGKLPPENRLAIRIRNQLHLKRRAELVEQEDGEVGPGGSTDTTAENPPLSSIRAAHAAKDSDDDEDDNVSRSATQADEKQHRTNENDHVKKDDIVHARINQTNRGREHKSAAKRQLSSGIQSSSPDRIDRRLQEIFGMMLALQREAVSEDSNLVRGILQEMQGEINVINKQLGRLESSVQTMNVNLRTIRDCVVSAGGSAVFAGLGPSDKDGDDGDARQPAAQEA